MDAYTFGFVKVASAAGLSKLAGIVDRNTALGGLLRLGNPRQTAEAMDTFFDTMPAMTQSLDRRVGSGPAEWLRDIMDAPTNLRSVDETYDERIFGGIGQYRAAKDFNPYNPATREVEKPSDLFFVSKPQNKEYQKIMYNTVLDDLENEARARRGAIGIAGTGALGLGAAGAGAGAGLYHSG